MAHVRDIGLCPAYWGGASNTETIAGGNESSTWEPETDRPASGMMACNGNRSAWGPLSSEAPLALCGLIVT